MQMAIAIYSGRLLGFSEMFFVYPHIDGFPLLCLVLAPVFALGAFISSRPRSGPATVSACWCSSVSVRCRRT